MKCVLYRKRKCHDIGGSELLSLHLALVVASAKLNENYHRIQRLRHVMASRQSSHSMTSYPQQFALPFAVCIFGGFGEIALAAVTTKNTRMSNRSANTKMV